jgi:hypothetical protein
VVYAQLKYMWASGSREESLNFLRTFATNLSRDLEAETTQRGQRSSVSKQKLDELARLLARCYFKQGEWQMELSDSWATVRETRALVPTFIHITTAKCKRHSPLIPSCHTFRPELVQSMAHLGLSKLRSRQPPSKPSRSKGCRRHGYHFGSTYHPCCSR